MLAKHAVAIEIRAVCALPVTAALILIAILSVGTAPTAIASPSVQVSTPTPTFNETQMQADSLLQEGDLLRSRSEFKDALEHYQRALPIYKAIGDRTGEVRALITIGFVYQTLGEHDKALEYYQKSWPEGETRTLNSIGAIYIELGDYRKALQYIQEALSIYEATEDRSGESAALINIGRIHFELGEYTTALEYFQEALQISREIPHPAREATALNNIGDTYGHLSEYQKALEHLFQALSIRRTIKDRVGEANTLNTIGVVYNNLGDYERAVEYSLEAIAVSSAIDYRVGEARGINTFAVVLDLLGEHQKSVEYQQRALLRIREIDNPLGESAILANIGANYYHLGEYAKAIENFQQALSIYRDIGCRAAEALILNNIGVIYDDLGNAGKGLEYCQQALSIQREIGDVRGQVDTLSIIGLIHEKRGDHQRALDYYIDAIAAIEEVRSRLGVEEPSVTFATRVSVIYEHAILILLKLNKTAHAFNYAERAKARTFLDLLGNQRVNTKGSENPQFIEQEGQLRAEIAALNRQLREEWSKPTDQRSQRTLDNITANLEARRQEYKNFLDQLQATNPEYAALVSVDPFTLEEAQTFLREQAPEVTLVAYFVGEEETTIFVVGPEAFHAEVVSVNRQKLRQQADALLAQMRAEPLLPEAWQQPAQALYDWLVAPVQEYLPPANPDSPPRLGIVPHDLLHYLPFGLLYDGEHTLMEGYTLFYAPSVSSLEFIFEKRHPGADTLLAFANPDAPGTSHLSYAEEEVQAVAGLYKTQPFVGVEATEGRFKTQAGQYGLVHIAAHSDYNPRSPLFSAILLQPDETEDGRVETHEVFNLDLPQTDLVVLSACETHLGELGAGDELVGLERAFVRAGSPSLLTTLWPVDDEATAELMERFYTHLRAGVPKAEALRLAQMETRKEHPEPYYWAGFVLVGDYGEGPASPGESWKQYRWLLWVGVGLIVTLSGAATLWWWRKMRVNQS